MKRVLGLSILMLLVTTSSLLAEEPKTKQSLEDCPKPVQKTMMRELKGLEIPQVEVLSADDTTIYRVVVKNEGRWYETKIDEDGKLVSKLLEKKLRQQFVPKSNYWVEVTLDGQVYDVCISVEGILLSKLPRESTDEEPAGPRSPAPLVLPSNIAHTVRKVALQESTGGEMTGVPILEKLNPRVPHTTFSFSLEFGSKKGTKVDWDIKRKPAQK